MPCSTEWSEWSYDASCERWTTHPRARGLYFFVHDLECGATPPVERVDSVPFPFVVEDAQRKELIGPSTSVPPPTGSTTRPPTALDRTTGKRAAIVDGSAQLCSDHEGGSEHGEYGTVPASWECQRGTKKVRSHRADESLTENGLAAVTFLTESIKASILVVQLSG